MAIVKAEEDTKKGVVRCQSPVQSKPHFERGKIRNQNSIFSNFSKRFAKTKQNLI